MLGPHGSGFRVKGSLNPKLQTLSPEPYSDYLRGTINPRDKGWGSRAGPARLLQCGLVRRSGSGASGPLWKGLT